VLTTSVNLGDWLELVLTNQSGADPAGRTVGAVEHIGIQVNAAKPGQGSRSRVNRDLREYCIIVSCAQESHKRVGEVQLKHQLLVKIKARQRPPPTIAKQAN